MKSLTSKFRTFIFFPSIDIRTEIVQPGNPIRFRHIVFLISTKFKNIKQP